MLGHKDIFFIFST